MDLDGTFKFIGVLQHAFGLPGLLIPIFSKNRENYYQIIEADDRIAQFQYLNVEDLEVFEKVGNFPLSRISETRFIEKAYSRQVGDLALYALRFPNRDTVIGGRSSISQILKNRIQQFDKFPAVKNALAEFLDDDELIQCTAEVLEERNVWRSDRRAQHRLLKNQIEEILEKENSGELNSWLESSSLQDNPSYSAPLRILRAEVLAKSRKRKDMLNGAILSKAKNALKNNQNKQLARFVEIGAHVDCLEAFELISTEVLKNSPERDFGLDNDLMRAIKNYPSKFIFGFFKKLVEDDLLAENQWGHVASVWAEEDPENYPEFVRKYWSSCVKYGSTPERINTIVSKAMRDA